MNRFDPAILFAVNGDDTGLSRALFPGADGDSFVVSCQDCDRTVNSNGLVRQARSSKPHRMGLEVGQNTTVGPDEH
jgi:hypothetical protein